MKRHPNTEPVDLRLGDDMIEALKEGKVDTALLGEPVMYGGFYAVSLLLAETWHSSQIKQISIYLPPSRVGLVRKIDRIIPCY